MVGENDVISGVGSGSGLGSSAKAGRYVCANRRNIDKSVIFFIGLRSDFLLRVFYRKIVERLIFGQVRWVVFSAI